MNEYFTRFIELDIKKSLDDKKIVLLLGARQTGKSTLLNHLLPDSALRINLQDPQKRIDYSRRLNLLTQQLMARTDDLIYVFIDEIQKVPRLLDEVQYLYDQNKERFRFILTGSSARKLVQKSSNLLPGRTHIYHLYPVIQRERGLKGIFPLTNPSGPCFPQLSLPDILLYGSLPGLGLESVRSRIKTLESYVDIYLEEEIRQEKMIRDIGLFANFLQLVAQQSGQMISFTNLSQEAGVSINTIKSYYQILVDSYIGYFVPGYSGNSRKRLLSTPRFFFFDPGIRNACARTVFHENLLNTEGGKLFEHWVGLELYHQLHLLGKGYELSYYRTVSGVEIDFIVRTPETIVPIECKWTQNPSIGDAKNIEMFLKENTSIKKGYLVCRCSEPRQITENVTAIPWNFL